MNEAIVLSSVTLRETVSPFVFSLFPPTSAVTDQRVIGKSRRFEKGTRILFDAVPLHIESDKNADSDGDHHDHGEELRLVNAHRAP